MGPSEAKLLGSEIARLRKAKGLSQEDLARASGVPVTAIRRCEQKGQIPLERYLKLASVLHASARVIAEPTVGRRRSGNTQQPPH